MNAGKLDVADEVVAPDCPLYFGSTFVGTRPEAFKQARAMLYAAFPDLYFTIEEMIGEGEKVRLPTCLPGAAGTKGSL